MTAKMKHLITALIASAAVGQAAHAPGSSVRRRSRHKASRASG